MLKKGQSVKFTRPVSTMKTVLRAVEQGKSTRFEIQEETGLRIGQISSALYNLTFIGVIHRIDDAQGRSTYRIPGRIYGFPDNLKGIRSIFDVK